MGDPVISAKEALAARARGAKFVDGSWRLPGAPGDVRAEFAARRIPGAVFFDIDGVTDAESDLPHMLPTPSEFARVVASLGLSPSDELVVYDTSGMFSAPRVWWTFRAFGWTNVSVLDGGLEAWLAAGGVVETGAFALPTGTPAPALSTPQIVAARGDVSQSLAARDRQVLDARSGARFRGEAPEPRPGLRGGHMPGAVSVPYTAVLAEDGRTMLEPDALRLAFERAGASADAPTIVSCGSGVTAAVLALALDRLGNKDVLLYDGSWAEWGLPGPTEVVTGA
jgi:thiosulfate/3-mercaptopyruvate sulfurtransferase